MEQLPYRLGVGIILLNKDNKVFVGKRINNSIEAWQMPQGGIDPHESPEQAVWRELAEEVGTNKAVIIAESPHWLSYNLPAEVVPTVWNGQYQGQQQKWFVMRFTGNDSDINLQTAHPEFAEWKWIDAEHLIDLIVPFKRQMYAELLEIFHHVLYGVPA